jgi:FimV-like protein
MDHVPPEDSEDVTRMGDVVNGSDATEGVRNVSEEGLHNDNMSFSLSVDDDDGDDDVLQDDDEHSNDLLLVAQTKLERVKIYIELGEKEKARKLIREIEAEERNNVDNNEVTNILNHVFNSCFRQTTRHLKIFLNKNWSHWIVG